VEDVHFDVRFGENFRPKVKGIVYGMQNFHFDSARGV
jgi:hypothetical protein